MTNQEAIEELKARKEHYEMGDGCDFLVEALERGIEALENQNSVIEELGKLKSAIELMDFDFGNYYDNTDIIIEMVSKVIDKSITQLKGDSNG